MRVSLLMLFAICSAAFAASPVVIGTESQLSLPTRGEFSGNITFQPGTNEVCAQNPPRFSWAFKHIPTLGYDNSGTESDYVREWNLQIATNNSFASPMVDVRTRFNYYNFIAPITNADGSTYTNWVYWRVGYFFPSNLSTAYAWVTNAFRMVSSSTQWNRSGWADDNSFTNTQHPRLWFNASTLTTVSNFIATNGYAAAWTAVFIGASNTVADPSWDCEYDIHTSTNSDFSTTNSLVHQTTNWANVSAPVTAGATNYYRVRYIYSNNSTQSFTISGSYTSATTVVWYPMGIAWETASRRLAHAGFAYQITRSSHFTNTAEQAMKLLKYFNASLFLTDWDGNFDPPICLAYGLDYSWSLLTAEQSNVVTADLNYIGTNLFGIATSGKMVGDTNMTILGGAGLSAIQYPTHQESHTFINGQIYVPLAMVGSGHSTNDANYLKWWLNYTIGAPLNWGVETIYSGRGYDPIYVWTGGKILLQQMLAHGIWPEAAMTNNMFWTAHGDWWTRYVPPGFAEITEPWGQGGGGGANYSWFYTYFGMYLSYFTQSPQLYQQYKHSFGNEDDTTYPTDYPTMPKHMEDICVRALYPRPSQANQTNTSVVFPKDGWVMMNSTNPNTGAAWSNAVGLNLLARPAGVVNNHAAFSGMLNYEMWAYGASVTDEGSQGLNLYNQYASQNYLAINGYAPWNWTLRPQKDNYGRIKAFTNSYASNPAFAYAAADGTELWPRQTCPDWAFGIFNWVTNVERHILFVRGKYFVIYDSFGASSNMIASQQFQIRPSATVDTNAGTWNYNATNWVNGSNVTVWVKQISTNNLVIENYTGTLVRTNPITGGTWDASASGDPIRSHAIWSRKNGVTNCHFLTVIYPQKWSDTTPTITRLSEYSVAVTNGVDGDVISFGETNALSTLVVDIGALPPEPPPSAPSAPTSLAATPGNQSVTLTWGNPDALADGIHVHGEDYSGGTNPVEYDLASSATSKVDSGLANGVARLYTVSRTNAFGSGSESVQATPAAPAGTSGRAYVSGRVTVGVLKQ